MSDTWHFDIARRGGGYQWRLFNRRGDLVMTSRETYPTWGSAKIAARDEAEALRQIEKAP